MAFMTLNGLTISVADGQASAGPKEIGERSRAFDGTMRVSNQSTKTEGTFETTPILSTDVAAYEGLIRGDGHVWSFNAADLLYSSKGLAQSASAGTVTSGTNPGTPKYSGALALSGGSVASSISWQPGVGSNWTVAVWRTTDNGATWHRHVVRSDGSKWLDGSSSGAATAWLTVSAPNLTLSDTAASAVKYDDLIFYPFAVPDSWATGALSTATSAWPAAPVLTLAGDVVPSGSLSVNGIVTGKKYLQGLLSGSFSDNLYTLSFALSEA